MQVNIQNFWNKSRENINAAHVSYSKGYYDAAASRYYYALFLAIRAYFKKVGVQGKRVQSYNGTYIEKFRHGDLIRLATDRLQNLIPNIGDILTKAKQVREKGDYDQTPVCPREYRQVRRNSRDIFKGIWHEINK